MDTEIVRQDSAKLVESGGTMHGINSAQIIVYDYMIYVKVKIPPTIEYS